MRRNKYVKYAIFLLSLCIFITVHSYLMKTKPSATSGTGCALLWSSVAGNYGIATSS